MNTRKYLLLLWLIITGLTVKAQTENAFLGKAVDSLSAHFQAMPVEKVYLHLDKPYYNPGDTIWFKAYTVAGNTHQLSALSNILYTELINENDSVTKRHILRLAAGLAWGSFVLPRSLKAGSYHIRAYTNWMRNAGAGYFYNQPVKIGAQPITLQSLKQEVPQKPDVQFFPEGGDLVNGLRSKIAVKSINAGGLGEDIKGTVIDNDGNEVAEFTTQHLGMGVFALMPQAGKTYTAKITGADSSQFTVALPPANDAGLTLTLNNSSTDSIYLKIAANDKSFQEQQNTTFYVIAQSAGKVYYTAAAKLASRVFTSNIAKARFPSGIVQFTLFSQSGDPLCERVVFVQNDDTLKLALSSPLQNYATRQKVTITLDTKSGDKTPASGSYSVAVTNESRVPADEQTESTIINNLLLTSDLKGYIEKPNYYFTNINDQTRADLDILMLTQGYRRFDWKKILNNANVPVVYQAEKELELDGTLKTPSGSPIPRGKVILAAMNEGYLVDTVADVNGNFKFTHLYLSDTAKIIIRARKEHNGSNLAIYVKQKDYPPVGKSETTKTNHNITSLAPQQAAALQSSYNIYLKQQHDDSLKNGRQLKEVVIKEKKINPPDIYNNYGTSLEYDVDMKKLNSEYVTIKDALMAMVPGLVYFNGKFFYESRVPVKFMIDGLTRSASDIDIYSPAEVDDIRMISGSMTNPSGLLMITSKRYAGTDTTLNVLKEVVIKSKKVAGPDMSESANLHGGGNADQVIMGDKVSGCITISDCLEGRVLGVSFAANGTPTNNREHGAAMSVIIDGVVMNCSHLNDLNADDIYSIEVLRSAAARSIYGSSISGGGALIITMKHGGEGSTYMTSESPAGLITYPFQGYHVSRTFYSPKYIHPKTADEPFDLRSTIYWNPNMISDKDGKISFDYFNNDTKGTYRVVVEGIDIDGNIGRMVFSYEVE
jgi:hypothetical protein